MSWSRTYTNQQIGNKDHLPPPASFASIAEQEQFFAARRAAIEIIQSKVIGHNTNYTVALSGTGNPGHPSGDTITVTVTAP
jgi:hypothetical protein